MPPSPSARSPPTGSPTGSPAQGPRGGSRWFPGKPAPRRAAGPRVVPGGCSPWTPRLGFERAWGPPRVDPRGVPPAEDLGQATAAQIRALTGRLTVGPPVPLFVFDAGYDPIALTVDLADAAVA